MADISFGAPTRVRETVVVEVRRGDLDYVATFSRGAKGELLGPVMQSRGNPTAKGDRDMREAAESYGRTHVQELLEMLNA